jgi:hypothetical protein
MPTPDFSAASLTMLSYGKQVRFMDLSARIDGCSKLLSPLTGLVRGAKPTQELPLPFAMQQILPRGLCGQKVGIGRVKAFLHG